MSIYKEPEWAVQPSQEWTLIEIKGGVEISRHSLHNRATSLFGRAVDQVHIPIHHESASRQHARIAFDAQGIPWLKDLNSTHGVTVNKRKLPPESIGKTESNAHQKGSRGVMIFPGDMLQFGASTRFYTLEGPPEFERGAVQAKLQQQHLQQQQRVVAPNEPTVTPASKMNSNKLDEGASSWGISMSDDEGECDESNGDLKDNDVAKRKTLPMDLQVPEKHRKSLEKLNSMKYKLDNLETEDHRIRRKGELTEGQEKQLQRNAEKEDALKRSIADLEEELYDKLYPDNDKIKGKGHNTAKSNATHVADDDEDDFFDRTKESHRISDVTTEAESEATLMAKWKKLYQQRAHVRDVSLPLADKRLSDLQEKMKQSQATEMEDAFFIQNDVKLAQEARAKVVSSLEDCEAAMLEVTNLLSIVNPKIHCDEQSGFIGEGFSPSNTGVHHTGTERQSVATQRPPPEMPPPPVTRRKHLSSNQGKSDTHSSLATPLEPAFVQKGPESGGIEPMMPSPKRKRVVGPTLPPSIPSTPANRNPPTVQTTAGTLAFLNSMTNPKESKRETPMDSEGSLPSKPKATQSAANPKEDVWQAPANQDGSGRTKLNEKFGGRY
jgi:pSer/pThr/pTyr-binding forkhead associated (FHA) protein